MGLVKPRVSSYVDRGNELIAKGKTKQAMNLVSHGLQYYSERVIDSMCSKHISWARERLRRSGREPC